MSEDKETPDLESLIENGKNKKSAYCAHCPSKILSAGIGQYEQIKFPLPYIRKRAEKEDGSEEEELSDYWVINDMYQFENIGYSNTVNGKKYLTCADCELGPLGWFDQETKVSYLAVYRVKYCD